MISRLLIANRAEIAIRIIRACQQMGIETVAAFSAADRCSMAVEMADEAVCIGGASSRDSYLNMAAIIEAAKACGADAVHPGYGFLSESAVFAALCEDNNLLFVGPSCDVLRLTGSKRLARQMVASLGFPVIPGYEEADQSEAAFAAAARQIGYPVVVKAVDGGGGKGMRVVKDAAMLSQAMASARQEARNAFASDDLYLEKYCQSVHHVEIQIAADCYGNVIHLFDRECSVQRRHQKLIEEAPSPLIDDKLREAMGEVATTIARHVDYVGVGTVEFIVDGTMNFYFLEINPRLQVEHPVTELITGIDIVQLQLRLAERQPLGLSQQDVTRRGHAIECRLCAEDPLKDLQPQAGIIDHWESGSGADLRMDTAVRTGTEVTAYYDSLLAKCIVWGRSRDEAIRKARHALKKTQCLGVATNQRLLLGILDHKDFIGGYADTCFIENHYQLLEQNCRLTQQQHIHYLAVASLWSWLRRHYHGELQRPVLPTDSKGLYTLTTTERFEFEGQGYCCSIVQHQARERFLFHCVELGEQTLAMTLVEPLAQMLSNTPPLLTVEIAGLRRRYRVACQQSRITVHSDWAGSLQLDQVSRFQRTDIQSLNNDYRASMVCNVIDVLVEPGQVVAKGQPLLVTEAMKMENTVHARQQGTITAVNVKVGDVVNAGAELLEIQHS